MCCPRNFCDDDNSPFDFLMNRENSCCHTPFLYKNCSQKLTHLTWQLIWMASLCLIQNSYILYEIESYQWTTFVSSVRSEDAGLQATVSEQQSEDQIGLKWHNFCKSFLIVKYFPQYCFVYFHFNKKEFHTVQNSKVAKGSKEYSDCILCVTFLTFMDTPVVQACNPTSFSQKATGIIVSFQNDSMYVGSCTHTHAHTQGMIPSPFVSFTPGVTYSTLLRTLLIY